MIKLKKEETKFNEILDNIKSFGEIYHINNIEKENNNNL